MNTKTSFIVVAILCLTSLTVGSLASISQQTSTKTLSKGKDTSVAAATFKRPQTPTNNKDEPSAKKSQSSFKSPKQVSSNFEYEQPIQELDSPNYQDNQQHQLQTNNELAKSKVHQQHQPSTDDEDNNNNKDPLADSEPALYGSVAGSPGVDFPAYTKVPKTSFSCDNKGFDFGFYADEEAQCQVYHVCWEGRRESFLCGIGTVFNQAILACDYWHSVDCSKSSQFYSVNNELGKAPTRQASSLAGARQEQTQQPKPTSSVGPKLAHANNSQQQIKPNQQQQQLTSTQFDDVINGFDSPSTANQPENQQQLTKSRLTPATLPRLSANNPWQQQQQQQQQQSTTKQPTGKNNSQQKKQSTPRKTYTINMDLKHKVSSLIESPVRLPLSSSTPSSTPSSQVRSSAKSASTQPNFRSAQHRSQLKTPTSYVTTTTTTPTKPPISQQQTTDEPSHQHQANFDDTLQTSTTPSAYLTQQQQAALQYHNHHHHAASSPDDSASAALISTYDQMSQPKQHQHLAPSPSPLTNHLTGASQPTTNNQQTYESSVDSDDFRAAGAKAAASSNQNWYIMHTV